MYRRLFPLIERKNWDLTRHRVAMPSFALKMLKLEFCRLLHEARDQKKTCVAACIGAVFSVSRVRFSRCRLVDHVDIWGFPCRRVSMLLTIKKRCIHLSCTVSARSRPAVATRMTRRCKPDGMEMSASSELWTQVNKGSDWNLSGRAIRTELVDESQRVYGPIAAAPLVEGAQFIVASR